MSGDESPEIKSYFAPLVPALIDFARRHNLAGENYPHGAVMVSLCFTHPKGGQAKIDLLKYSEDMLTVTAVWWIDTHAEFTRRLKRSEKIYCPKGARDVIRTLESLLGMVLHWPLDAWDQVATDYKQSWGRYTAEEFAGLAPNWPVART